MFRLALNVASTRIILLHGEAGPSAAGKVIQAFGNFVVGGNYFVGVIVFLILVTINFIVITKGAGRIAEVAARFTLDAMPGKQMSIDADLNAGLITEREAIERRQAIAREAEYYGAMDGANKFVRGDAIAGIIITLVNIVAGLAIGVFQNDMSFGDASQTYTLLTVGDGLVTQIPALIVSTAAGMVVSRAGTDASLGSEVGYQILAQPRAIGTAGLILLCIGLFPGLPTVPFMVLALIAGTLAYVVAGIQKSHVAETQQMQEIEEQTGEQALPEGHIETLPPLDALSLEVGYGLIPLVDVDQNGELLDRIKSIRRQMAQEIGLVVPSIHIQDNMQLKPSEYVISLKGNEVARGELRLNHYLAMRPEGGPQQIEGIPTTEPTYGLPAIWISEGAREDAMAKGYTVVNLATVLTTHLSDVVRRYAHELLGRQEVQKMLDHIKSSHPKVIEELVPNVLPLGVVVKVLQNLLREQVSIRDLPTVLEALADWGALVKDVDTLTEYARQALARTISKQYLTPDGAIPVLALSPEVETAVAEAIQHTDHGTFLALDPTLGQEIMNRLAEQLDRFMPLNAQPIVVCSPQVRPHFKKLVDRFIPNLVVLSYSDILSNVQIQTIGMVELAHADQAI